MSKSSAKARLPETRERIVQAARNLFHEKGYTAVGVADICTAAGVVKGSFYHFFPAKSDLLIEVTRRNWAMTKGVLDQLLESSDPGRDRIESFMQMIVANAQRMHRQDGAVYGCNIGVLASELSPAETPAQAELKDIFRQWRQALLRLVEAGRRDGSISSSVNASAAASALLASIQGMSTLGRTFNDPAMLKLIAQSAMNQVFAP